MPRTLDRFLLAAVLFAGGSSLAGCKQGEGERCELHSDCSAGLMCVGDPKTGVCSASPAQPAADASAGGGDTRSSSEAAAPVSSDGGGPDEGIPADVAAPTPDVTPAVPDLAPDVRPDGTSGGDGSSG